MHNWNLSRIVPKVMLCPKLLKTNKKSTARRTGLFELYTMTCTPPDAYVRIEHITYTHTHIIPYIMIKLEDYI